MDTTPPLPPPSPPPSEEVLNSISQEELRDLSEAVATLKGERQLQAEIQELKEEREEYREVRIDQVQSWLTLLRFFQDVAELVEESQEAQKELKESKASERLGRKVEGLITQLDSTLWQLERDYVSGDSHDLATAQQDK